MARIANEVREAILAKMEPVVKPTKKTPKVEGIIKNKLKK